MIIVNPGTGPIHNATLQNAEANISQLVSDIIERLPRDLAATSITATRDPGQDSADDGRYGFTIALCLTSAGNISYEASRSVEMPGLPLEAVNFGARDDDSAWDFPRLYVDGSSWLWKYALEIICEPATAALANPSE